MWRVTKMKKQLFNNIFKCLLLKNGKGLDILLYIKTHPGCNVKQIHLDLGIDQVTTSVALNEMKKVGIVDCNKEWYNRIYKIINPFVDQILDMILSEEDEKVEEIKEIEEK